MFSSLITFLHRAIMQGIPLLFGSTGEIMTEKSGNLNLGIPGVMYIGGMSGVIGAFLYENSLESKADAVPFLAVLIPLLCCILGSFLAGLLYCFLTVTLRANQNVTGLALTTFGTGFGNFFGGSLIKITGSDVPSVALTTTSGFSEQLFPVRKARVGSASSSFHTDFLHMRQLLLQSHARFSLIAQGAVCILGRWVKILPLPMQQASM